MSTNTYNIIHPVYQDPNTYNIEDIKIDFFKSYKIEYNEIYTNKSYDFAPLLNTNGILLKTEFNRKDPLTYIKIKSRDDNADIWLYQVGKHLSFSKIRDGLYSTVPPLTLWIEYPREGEFYLYTLNGFNVESVMKKKLDGKTNISFLNYKEINDQIYMRWSDNVNDATKFHYKKILWSDEGWIKLEDKAKQRQILSGNKH